MKSIRIFMMKFFMIDYLFRPKSQGIGSFIFAVCGIVYIRTLTSGLTYLATVFPISSYISTEYYVDNPLYFFSNYANSIIMILFIPLLFAVSLSPSFIDFRDSIFDYIVSLNRVILDFLLQLPYVSDVLKLFTFDFVYVIFALIVVFSVFSAVRKGLSRIVLILILLFALITFVNQDIFDTMLKSMKF